MRCSKASNGNRADADTNGEDDDNDDVLRGKAVRADEEVSWNDLGSKKRIRDQIGSILLQVSKTRVELIVEALKKRLRSRVALQKQLDALVKVRLRSLSTSVSSTGIIYLHYQTWLIVK